MRRMTGPFLGAAGSLLGLGVSRWLDGGPGVAAAELVVLGCGHLVLAALCGGLALISRRSRP